MSRKYSPSKGQRKSILAAIVESGLSLPVKGLGFLSSEPENNGYRASLGENIWVFSRNDLGLYRHCTDLDKLSYSEGWRSQVVDFSFYSKGEIEDMVSSTYSSLDTLRELHPNDWIMISLECGFREALV